MRRGADPGRQQTDTRSRHGSTAGRVTCVRPEAARFRSRPGRLTQAASCPTRQGAALPRTGAGSDPPCARVQELCVGAQVAPVTVQRARLHLSGRRGLRPGRPARPRASVVSVRTCATPVALMMDRCGRGARRRAAVHRPDPGECHRCRRPAARWPRQEHAIDVLHKVVYALAMGLLADRLVSERPASAARPYQPLNGGCWRRPGRCQPRPSGRRSAASRPPEARFLRATSRCDGSPQRRQLPGRLERRCSLCPDSSCPRPAQGREQAVRGQPRELIAHPVRDDGAAHDFTQLRASRRLDLLAHVAGNSACWSRSRSVIPSGATQPGSRPTNGCCARHGTTPGCSASLPDCCCPRATRARASPSRATAALRQVAGSPSSRPAGWGSHPQHGQAGPAPALLMLGSGHPATSYFDVIHLGPLGEPGRPRACWAVLVSFSVRTLL